MRTHLKLFKALSDRSRLRIVKMLEVKPMCVCEITSVLGLAPSTVSKHLSLLEEAGLVEALKDGKWVNYALALNFQVLFVEETQKMLAKTLNKDPMVVQDRARAQKADRIQICR
jgi:ArsR family transcriptional regulator